MRLFSQNEKKIIQQLVKAPIQPYSLEKMFNDISYKRNVTLLQKTPTELVLPYNENLSDDDKLTINEVLERVFLMNYLEQEGLVYLIPKTKRLKVSQKVLRTNIVTVQIDTGSGKIFLKSVDCLIYVSETLRDYVNNGFKSLEEQILEKNKRQIMLSHIQLKKINWTKWSISASLFTSVSALVSALASVSIALNVSCSRNNNETNFDSNSTEVAVPLNAMLNYMQNNLDGKLDATMNNTAEIKAKLCDSIVIKNPCDCKKPSTPKVKSKVKPMDNCLKYIRIDTCQDTIISKQQVGKLLPE